MLGRHRLVFDTNTLVSAGIRLNSTPAKALRKALENDLLLCSEKTWLEFEDVWRRPKFDRYRSSGFCIEYLIALRMATQAVDLVVDIQACRHPPDDKFLSLAVSGQADCIITGDSDLLALHPFREISILSPAAYLDF